MKTLKIMCLYPNEMNIYGDHGNLLALQKRAEWHGFDTEYIQHEPNKKFDTSADIIIGGGGQDSGQDKIQADLLKNGAALHKLAAAGTPMLMICGLYQLFGHYFETHAGHHIDGIGIFDAWTKAGPTRLIGNIIIEAVIASESEAIPNKIEIIGYENHSGLTYLNKAQKAFGKVVKGAGNNGSDGTEGARTNNVFGSYLHGPILPKNPALADELIRLAAIKKFGSFEPKEIDDTLATKARDIATTRPR
ncbi:MAG: glutamine amidotransferase [Candidatus Nomurabacteria bacterium]|jgi:CobQ-like glutamine amidotransferase family enzyme|nr:glutamine amidotransferase [Candidatus Nomurabacteria bacterium]